MSLIPQLERELVDAVRRQSPQRRGASRRVRPSVVAAIAVALLALAAAALAATHFLGSGAPLVPPAGTPLSPATGLGVVRVGSARMLPIAVRDPAGGPPWGLRFVTTTRGIGCLQTGRLVRGEIGVIGQDGVFRDDGRFHALAANYLGGALVSTFPCGTLDARGHAFAAVAINGAPASGLLTPSSTQRGCVPFRDHGPIGRRPNPPPVCPLSDWRLLYLGMAGPEAKSITYVAGGRSHTVRTVGEQGAYLIVLPLRIPPLGHGRLQLGSFEPLQGAGGGPIIRVEYRNGHVCRLTPRPDTFGGQTCPPIGRAPETGPSVRPEDVRSPIKATIRSSHLGPMLVLSFRARLAVSDASTQYAFSVRVPGHAPNCGGGVGGPLIHNNHAGEREQFNIPTNGCHGRFHGTVTYTYGLTSDLPPAGRGTHTITVGRFALNVP